MREEILELLNREPFLPFRITLTSGMMNVQDELLVLRRRKPFVPFRVTVSDGRTFEVTEPFMYAWNELSMLIAKKPGFVTFRQSEIVSIDLSQPST